MLVQQFGEILSSSKNLRNHILKVTGVALLLAIFSMLFLDQPIALYFIKPENKETWYLPARELTDQGLSGRYFALSILVWLFCRFVVPRIASLKSKFKRADYFRRWGLNFLLALLVSGALIHLVKILVGRQRPHVTETFDPLVFKPFNIHWYWQSFASGHSQVMFTVATLMIAAFPRGRWAWILYATLVCLTRVIVEDHFLSDTIFGACVGYVGALLAMRFMKVKTSNGLY